MRVYLVLLLFFSLNCFAASVVVTVTEPINSRSDEAVRFAAKLKAKSDGIDRLPLIIVGHEKLVNNEYSEKIEALSAGSVHIRVLSESFDRIAETYTLNASVELDEAAALSILQEIRAGQEARGKLADAYESLDNKIATVSKAAGREDWTSVLSSSNITPASFARATPEATQGAIDSFILESSAAMFTDTVDDFIKESKVKLVSQTQDKVEIEVIIPRSWFFAINWPFQQELAKRTGREAPDWYARNDTGEPCLVERVMNDRGQMSIVATHPLPERELRTYGRFMSKNGKVPTGKRSVRFDISLFGNDQAIRNLHSNFEQHFKLQACFNNTEFYEAVLRLRKEANMRRFVE